MPFSWDAGTARYRDAKGHFVKPAKVIELSHASLQASGDFALDLAKQAEKLRPKETVAILREEIKGEAIRQYILGRGGLAQMDKKDWGTLGAIIKDQYNYLPGFEADMPELSEGQVANRMGMYISSTREAFEKGKLRSVKESGKYTKELWVMDPAKEHCPECQMLADMGWVPIGTLGQFPGDGETSCKTRCGCHIEYQ